MYRAAPPHSQPGAARYVAYNGSYGNEVAQVAYVDEMGRMYVHENQPRVGYYTPDGCMLGAHGQMVRRHEPILIAHTHTHTHHSSPGASARVAPAGVRYSAGLTREQQWAELEAERILQQRRAVRGQLRGAPAVPVGVQQRRVVRVPQRGAAGARVVRGPQQAAVAVSAGLQQRHVLRGPLQGAPDAPVGQVPIHGMNRASPAVAGGWHTRKRRRE